MSTKRYPGVFEYYNSEQFMVHSSGCLVVMNGYWIKTDDDFMKNKRTGIWQYHTIQSIAEQVSKELPGTTVEFIQVCYVPKEPK